MACRWWFMGDSSGHLACWLRRPPDTEAKRIWSFLRNSRWRIKLFFASLPHERWWAHLRLANWFLLYGCNHRRSPTHDWWINHVGNAIFSLSRTYCTALAAACSRRRHCQIRNDISFRVGFNTYRATRGVEWSWSGGEKLANKPTRWSL